MREESVIPNQRLHTCYEPNTRHRRWDLTRGKPWPVKPQELYPAGLWALKATQGKQVAALPEDEAGEADDELSHHRESAPAAATPFKPWAAQGS